MLKRTSERSRVRALDGSNNNKAPKPDPGAVAGVAAAAAAAATLASPQAAAHKQEENNKGEPDDRGVEVKETVPADVFDRLDHKAGDAGVDVAAPADPAHER
jgi:ribosomal protein L12E/L44/L45/RPP1/RPP2